MSTTYNIIDHATKHKKILHNFRYDYYWAALCSITTAVGEIVNCSQLWYDINYFSNVILLEDRIIYSRDGIRIGISFSPNNSLAVFSYYLSHSVHYSCVVSGCIRSVSPKHDDISYFQAVKWDMAYNYPIILTEVWRHTAACHYQG